MKNATRVLVVITFIAMLVVNTLANTLPINGLNTGAISDSYPNLFAPAGYTFTIWAVIYILLTLFTIYQVGIISKKDEISNEFLTKIGFYFSITSLANTIWMFTWHYRVIWLSVIFMLIILITLMKITSEIKKERLTVKEKFFVKLPFSIYYGWITVATIANIVTFLVSINFNGLGLTQTLWTVIILIVGAIIGIITLLYNRDYFYGLVIAWAYFGIMIKHLTIFDGIYTAVVICVTICIICILSATIYAFTKREY